MACLILMGCGWKRGESCRVTSWRSSLWSMALRSFMTRTMQASVSKARASSTFSSVSLASSTDSTLFATCWILIRASEHVKPALKMNLSPSLTSRPLGDLSRILYLAHARDCSVRRRSPDGIPVAMATS